MLPPRILDKSERERLLAEGRKAASFAVQVWNLVREQRQHGAILEKQAAEIATLTERVRALEGRERELLARAEAEATRAAAQLIADMARRIGRLEATRDSRSG